MNVLDTIGNTPLIKVNGIWCKCEHLNPSGSTKDRIAKEMICSDAPTKNRIIEVSSGNTGISVAMVCSVLNLDCIVVVPRNTNKNKIKLMMKYGADIVFVDDMLAGKKLIKKFNNVSYIDQFSNGRNVVAQEEMAKEIYNVIILEEDDIRKFFVPDAIVTGIGTSGTLAALFMVFPESNFFTWQCDKQIEGVSDGVSLPLKPKSCNLTIVDIKYRDVCRVKKWLASHHGLDVGYSSAANYLTADFINGKYKNILTIFTDAGWHYTNS